MADDVKEAEITEPKISEEEALKAKEALEQEKKERSKRCHDRIEAILKEENCFIDVMMILRSGQIVPQADIVAR